MINNLHWFVYIIKNNLILLYFFYKFLCEKNFAIRDSIVNPDSDAETVRKKIALQQACLEKMTLKQALLSSSEETDTECTTVNEINMKKKIKILRKCCKNSKKNIKRLQMKVGRYKLKCNTLKSVLKELDRKNLLSEDQLFEMFGATGPSKAILRQQIETVKRGKKRKQYSPEVRVFAMNLHFYSPKAYNYVRTTLGKCLPHTRTLSLWYRTINGKPGFTQESFETLKNAVFVAKEKNELLYITVMSDEMAIHQKIERTQDNQYGFVSFGGESESDVIATNVYVIMAVCVNKHWKIPLAYFPVKALRGDQKYELKKMTMEMCMECGVIVLACTFDAISSNLTCAKLFGCNLSDYNNLSSIVTFEKYNQKVCLFLDPVHMLKLMRNLFDHYKLFYDADGNAIEYKYLVKLIELQEAEGLHLGNKLTRAHVFFHKRIMKVKLAAQLLSESVADAIEFCQKELELPDFIEATGTIIFIRNCNKIFDVLNSRSICEKQPFKRALSKSNYERIESFAQDAISYLRGKNIL